MTQAKVIREIAENGSCGIIGRCSDYILAENPDLVKVFVYAPLKNRAEHCVSRGEVSADKAVDYVKGKDKRRQNYYNYHSDTKWGEAQNYNLCIDSGFCGTETAADMIISVIKAREAAAAEDKQ